MVYCNRISVWIDILREAADSKQIVNTAVVGAGYWGPNIIRNIQENPSCRLYGVCDLDPDKLARVTRPYGSDLVLTNQYSDFLNNPEIQAIAVVTDIPSHFNLAQQALEAGKHVFVEKPLATTANECLALGALAEKAGKTLMVGHTFIYNPAVVKLKNLLQSGELGDLYYMHAQRLNLGRVQTNINTLWSLAVHDIAIALYIFEELPTVVRSWGHAFLTPGIEDVTFLNMQFPSGRLAHIHVSWLDPEKRRQVTLVGKKKMAVYDDVSIDRKISIYDKGVTGQDPRGLKDVTHAEYTDFSGFQYLTRSGDVSIPNLKFEEPLKVEVQHFVDCIQGKIKKPTTSWQEGYEVVNILQSSQDSLQHGGIPIELNWREHPTYARV